MRPSGRRRVHQGDGLRIIADSCYTLTPGGQVCQFAAGSVLICALGSAEDSEMDYAYSDTAKMIDHSLLDPVLTDRELEQGCRLGVEYDVASVCIMPSYLR